MKVKNNMKEEGSKRKDTKKNIFRLLKMKMFLRPKFNKDYAPNKIHITQLVKGL